MSRKFPFCKQPDSMDCGSACLQMISSFYGRDYSLDTLRRHTFAGIRGVSLLGISKAAERLGFRTVGGRFSFDRFATKAPFPCIVHWNQDHFVIVYKIKKSQAEAGKPR